MEYCLNREPLLFQHTSFQVDKFHYNHNHTCCPMFSLDHFPDAMLDFVNSSSGEGCNTYTTYFKSQVSYMKQATFMEFMHLMYGVRNSKINQKLRHKTEHT